MNPYLNGLESIYTPWILLFSYKGRLQSPLLSATLMRDKYPLHIINETKSIVGPLRDLVYTYEYKETITSIWMIILDGEAWRFIMSLILLF
jgi:hypothetical protein